MHARVTRTMASVGSTMVASGTFSTRTSPAAYMMVARMVYCFEEEWVCRLIDRFDGHFQLAAGIQGLDARLDPSQAHQPPGKRLVPIEDGQVSPRRVVRDVAP